MFEMLKKSLHSGKLPQSQAFDGTERGDSNANICKSCRCYQLWRRVEQTRAYEPGMAPHAPGRIDGLCLPSSLRQVRHSPPTSVLFWSMYRSGHLVKHLFLLYKIESMGSKYPKNIQVVFQ